MSSPPRQVVIDDTDSQIRYSSGWFQDQGSQDNVGNYGPTYKTTSHGTKGKASISFSFVGSSVTVWGTTSLKKVDNGTSFDPSWECFIDQKSIGATKPFQFPENNWVLCESGSVIDGPHVITINVTSAGNTFWFDYLTYTPSPAVSYETAVLLVQNTDSAIQYDAGWGKLGDTANMTTKVGSEVQFKFIGTSLTWVGFIPIELPHNPSTASYSIDSGNSISFKLNGLSPTVKTTIYNQVFFTTPNLPIGPHSILVTYEGSDAPSTPLTLDYLFITNTSLPMTAGATATSSATITSTSPAASKMSLPVTQGTTVTSSAFIISTSPVAFNVSLPATTGATVKPPDSVTSTSPVATPSQAPTAESKTLIAPIVGGVVGGLAAIVILLFAFCWWRRRRVTHISSGTGTTTPFMHPLQAQPFTLLYPSSGEGQPLAYVHSQSDVSKVASSSRLQDNNTNNSSSSVNQSQSHTPTHTTHATSIDTPGGSGHAAGTIDQNRNAAPGPTITSVVHQDSGKRLHPPQPNVIIEEIPPMYTAV